MAEASRFKPELALDMVGNFGVEVARLSSPCLDSLIRQVTPGFDETANTKTNLALLQMLNNNGDETTLLKR